MVKITLRINLADFINTEYEEAVINKIEEVWGKQKKVKK